MAESTKYGPWVAGDDWRSWVGVSITSETATTATVKVRGWFESDAGSSTGSGNVKGWVGHGIGNGSVTWSSAVNIDPFAEGAGYYYKTQSWTITKTHAAQTVWGYADVEGQAGLYSGTKSQCYASVSVGAKTSYTVTFNNNGGSGAPDAQTKWYGETLTLSSTKPTRTGYTFSGWNTKADGSGTNYASGGSYTGNAALTLYAKWTAVTYGITYKANGGTGSDQTQTKTYGVNATLKAANTFTRTNYTFTNWNTAANGSGTPYAAGSTYATNAALILYAQWQLTTYSVTFNANGGTGAPAAQTKNSGSALTLSSVVPTRSGYGFLGWATTQARANAGTVDYAAGGTVAATTNQNLSLYAAWKVAAPTLEIVSAFRSSGNPDWEPADDGTNAVVTINAESQTSANLSFSVTVGSVTVTSPSATAGNTRTFRLEDTDLSADQAYAVSVTATDSNGSTTKTTVIQTAWYAIDVKRGGHGVAFGKVASEDNLADFGMDVKAEKLFTAESADVSQETNKNVGFYAKRTDLNHGVAVAVGSGGVNRGLLDLDTDSWIVHVNSTGEAVYSKTPHKTTSTVTLSGGTATANVCWSNGIMAGFTLRGLKLSSALSSGSHVTIGTLPEGYRPTQEYRYPAVHSTTAALSGRCFLAISTSGTMQLYNESGSSLATTATLYVSDTYPI